MRKNIFLTLFSALALMLMVSCGSDSESDSTPNGSNNGNSSGVKANMHNGHEYVDLALPSGLKWATCNVGATSPELSGTYFAWGEAHFKAYFSSDTYKWSIDGSDSNFSKYTPNDGKSTLDAADDAAAVNWGGNWRMPTREEFLELISYCQGESTTVNGLSGYKFTSSQNGKSIFLPACGLRRNADLYYPGDGYYWSSSRNPHHGGSAFCLHFNIGNLLDYGYFGRLDGRCVRAVCP